MNKNEKKINFLFIGTGKVARHHAEVIISLGHNIINGFSRSESKKHQDFIDCYCSSVKKFKSFKEMIKIERPDAIIICVSWDQIELVLKKTILFSLPILVEKPVALSSKSLKEIIKLEKKYATKILVGFNRRYYENIQYLKKEIQNQKLLSVNLILPEAFSHVNKSFRIQEEFFLHYMTSHWIDLVIYLLGDLEISYVHKNIPYNPKSLNCMFHSSVKNTPIHLSVDFDTSQNLRMSFVTSYSTYVLEPVEMLRKFNTLIREPVSKAKKLNFYKPLLDKEISADFTYKPGFYSQIKNFVQLISSKKNYNHDGAKLDDALKVTKIIEDLIMYSKRK